LVVASKAGAALMKAPGLKFLRKTTRHLFDRAFPGGIILMYHRIAECEYDPWANCVSPEHFEEHLEAISRLVRPLRLGDMTDSLENGRTPSGCIALTFDDGYADNYHVARPLLEAHDIPATFFLVSEQIESGRAYWWDDLADILLRTGQLPETLEITLGGRLYEIHLGPAATYSAADRQADHGVREWTARPGSRLSFYYRICMLLRALSHRERSGALDEIRRWAGGSRPRAAAQATITCTEAHKLAAGGLIEVGSHSQLHASLPNLSIPCQRQEIANSRADLEGIIGRPVRSFAYPYGSYGRDTPGLVKEEGFARACTITPRHVRSGDDPYLLPRLSVSDWDGEEFTKRLFKLLPT
jgi:peptidoglycan/xylan/chitin deacetylase (PgdA/CDA1 family)